MKAASLVGIIAGTAVIAGAAIAAPPAQKSTVHTRPHVVQAPAARAADPLTIQGVRMVNGHVQYTTPVMPYAGGAHTRTNPQYAWDAYESGPGAASVPGQPPGPHNYYILEW